LHSRMIWKVVLWCGCCGTPKERILHGVSVEHSLVRCCIWIGGSTHAHHESLLWMTTHCRSSHVLLLHLLVLNHLHLLLHILCLKHRSVELCSTNKIATLYHFKRQLLWLEVFLIQFKFTLVFRLNVLLFQCSKI